jgi:hypothetical protein
MPRLPRSPLTTVATAALAGSVVLGGGAAWAAWSSTGTGAGATAAGSLVTPVVTATRSTTSPTSAIDVSWTAAGELPGTTYSVKRDGTTTLACTSSPCTDSGLAPGTSYSYVVTANLGTSWSSASDPAAASTQAAAVNATSYAVSVASSVTAGTPAQVTITAKRPDNSTDTGYTGSKSLTLSGTSTATSPAGTAATLPTSATFNNGAAVVSATFVTAGSGLGLIATTGSLTGSTSVTVNAANASKLAFTNMVFGGQAAGNVTFTSCYASAQCSAALGNGGSLTTRVSLVDAFGNLAKLGTNTTVAVSFGGQTTTSGTSAAPPLTIPAGTSTSSWTASVTEGNASYTGTVTATSDPLTAIVATVTKN